jgi:NAD(P)-dependent dehydrogenase (short-subunit alcohol dehydrogenase family)
MHPWLLVSSASSGIGLAISRRLLTITNAPIIATTRRDPDETKRSILNGLNIDEKRLEVLKVDVRDEETIAAAASHCRHRFPWNSYHLHLSFTTTGILHPEKSLADIDQASALLTFHTNTIGPLLLMKHFAPFLPRKSTTLPSFDTPPGADDPYHNLSSNHAHWAVLSARVGSITDNSLGGWYTYRASKAALNQAIRTLDRHLEQRSGRRAFALALHPGTVQTQLSREFWGNVKEGKLFSPEFVAARLVGLCSVGVAGQKARDGGVDVQRAEDVWSGTGERIGPVGAEGRGRLWDYDCREVPP